MIKPFINSIFFFVVLIVLQVFVFNSIQFSGLINPYFYVIYILLLPFETPGWILLISSFFLGFFVDTFCNTLGLHTAACTFMAVLRPSVLKSFSPRDGYEPGTLPRLSYYGFTWFLKYTLLLVLAHHIILFYFEIFRLSDFLSTLLRVLLSTLFTTAIIVLSQFFIFRK
jgi:rod shape-determining protein MreD